MRAIGYRQVGGPDVLEVVELPEPVPSRGELRIRVHAAAVNPTDTMRRIGTRGAPEDGSDAHVPGMDVAGILEEIGEGTDTNLAVDDRVMAVVVPSGGHGAYSEQVVVPAESVVRAPKGSSHAEASTLPMNGLTARAALDILGLEAGQVVAVTGAAGAMGGYAVQLAKAYGLTVVADAAGDDEELVTTLGADVVLPRGEQFADRVRDRFPDGVDGAVDGALLHAALAPALRDGGVVVTVRGYDEPAERGVTFRPVWVWEHAREHGILDELRTLAEEGAVTLRVADEYPMAQASEAHRRLEGGGVRGRLVLTF